jgi:hypothetical protein
MRKSYTTHIDSRYAKMHLADVIDYDRPCLLIMANSNPLQHKDGRPAPIQQKSRDLILQWLRDLFRETWASSLVLVGFASSVLTFFPGLRSYTLRIMGLTLLGIGFVWANFRVYVRLLTEIAKRAARQRDLVVSLSVEGDPPNQQFMRVTASENLMALQLDYLLSNGTCIATDECHFAGRSFDIPIQDSQITKIWNLPRIDRNTFDGSGPAMLRIKLTADGDTFSFELPIHMKSHVDRNTYFRKLIGSEEFRRRLEG